MARKRSRSSRVSHAQPVRGSYSPRTPPPGRAPRPVLVPNLYLRTRARPLDHSVFGSRTVRPVLMRTVLRDTSRPNRRSPDVPVRALARLKSVNPYMAMLERSWPAFSESSLQRASHCARRSIRREVLFATRQTNGAGSRGRPKSKEKC